MGQVPAKYMMPSSPYGGSQAANVLNAAQPPGINPQTPLLPTTFTDPGTTVRGFGGGTPGMPTKGNPLNPTNPQAPQPPRSGAILDPRKLFGL